MIDERKDNKFYEGHIILLLKPKVAPKSKQTTNVPTHISQEPKSWTKVCNKIWETNNMLKKLYHSQVALIPGMQA